MKGYKGMSKNMTCRGMKFEIGKSYHVDGHIEVCKHGIHFCRELKEVFKYYCREESRYFEIEATGSIKDSKDGEKSATSDITILRELSDIEVNRIAYGYGNGDGNGDGNGYGDGNGNGYGDGNGNGYGNGNGCGYGDGNGYGNGNGDGYGDGYGYGYGNGYGSNIQKVLIFI